LYLSTVLLVSTVDADSIGDGEQRVDGPLVGGIIGGILFVAIVVIIVSLFLCYR